MFDQDKGIVPAQAVGELLIYQTEDSLTCKATLRKYRTVRIVAAANGRKGNGA